MPVIKDPLALEGRRGTLYPKQFAGGLDGRVKRALTESLGLTQFGVNVTTLEAGAISAQRHWHEAEDEFIYVLSGEITLVKNAGSQVLPVGAAVGFPKGDGDGHQLVNRSNAPATYLEIGTRAPVDDVDYPDIDMKAEKRDGKFRFLTKKGEPYA